MQSRKNIPFLASRKLLPRKNTIGPRLNRAINNYRRAQAIFEKTFGSQHYEVAANLDNLALPARTVYRF